MDKMRDAIRNITTFHQRSKYSEEDDEEQSGGLNDSREDSITVGRTQERSSIFKNSREDSRTVWRTQ